MQVFKKNVYGLIRTHVPMFASTKKSTRYVLNDNFLIFWFRYIFKYNYMLEIELNAWSGGPQKGEEIGKKVL